MKTKFFTFLAAFMALFVISTNVAAQAVGDYGSTAASGTPGTMDWLTGTWYVCTSVGTWAGSTTTTTPPDQTKNVWILANDVVNLSYAGTTPSTWQCKCNNLEVAGTMTLVDYKVENSQVYGNIHVASTGTITANPKIIWGNYSASPSSLTIDAGGKFYCYDQFKPFGSNGATTTITNNGTLGIATKTAGSGATIYMVNQSSAVGNSNVIFTGTGTTIFRRLYADTNAGTFNITFDQDVTFTPSAGEPGIKLNSSSGVTATSARTITINAGKTVTIFSGWFANSATVGAGDDANNTYNINGTLDASAASIYFGCTSSATTGQRGTTNSQIINIGSAGVLKCGVIVDVNKPQSGQTLAVNVATGGTITYAGTAYQTLPTASTFAVTSTPYALLTNSNSNLSFTNASTAVTMNTDLSVSDNLVLSAAGTLATGANTLTLQGIISGSGLINTGSTGTLAFGGTLEQTLAASNLTSGAVNNIIINAGSKLTTSGAISATTLTINSSNTNGTGTLVDNGTLTATNASVQQYLTAARNWFISSPVTGATSDAVTASPSQPLYYYVETTPNVWSTITNTATGLNLMQGYVANISTDRNIVFTGTLNTGPKSISTLSSGGASFTGYNLVGNPYPSYVNWTTATKTNVGTSIWYRSKSTGAYLFQTYNVSGPGIGVNGGSNLIPPMQSFWVNVTSGTGAVGFVNTDRSHQDQSIASNRLKAPAVVSQQILRLQVSNDVNTDEAVVYFDANAMDTYDAYDSRKMTNNNVAIPEIYTVAGNDNLAINGLKTLTPNQELPLGFTTGQSNAFSIKATEFSNFDSNTKVYLKDKVLGTEQDLTGGTAYSFSSDVTSTSSRFSVIFKSAGATTGLNATTADQAALIYKNANNQITVNFKGDISSDAVISVYNTVGQKLQTKQITSASTVIGTALTSGVYVVTVNNGGKSTTQKVILN